MPDQERRKVYFVTGNGQPDPNNSDNQGYHDALVALQNDNYVVDTLDATLNKVPDDASAVILAAGTKPFLPQEKQAFSDYLAKGGKMLVMSGAFATNNDLNDILKPFGLGFQDGVTIDPAVSLQGNPQVPAVSQYAAPTSPIVKSAAVTIYPLASGISVASAPQGINITTVAKTSDQSWLQNHQDQIAFRQGDTRGPINLIVNAEGTLPTPSPSASPVASGTPVASPSGSGAASASGAPSASGAAAASGGASAAPAGAIPNATVVATPPPASPTAAPAASGTPQAGVQPTITPTPIPQVSGSDVNLKGGTRIVAVADTQWIDGQFLEFPRSGNHDLFLNAIDYLVGNDALIGITPKTTTPSQVFLLGSDQNLIFFTTVLFVPLAVLIVGGIVWWQRR